jgi:hypothetical protein
LFDLPSIPQPALDLLTGVADAASLGLGPFVRGALGVDGGVNRCSTAYKVGEYGSLALGAGRLLYAGAAKALPLVITGGEDALATALQVSAARNMLKQVARGGLFPNTRMPSAADVLQKYLDPQAIIEAATRTNAAVNAIGSNAAIGGAVNAATCGCQ